MKIRDEIKFVINGRNTYLTKYTMEDEEKFEDSLLHQVISINLKSSIPTVCAICKEPNNNWCWNCEKPHCKKHSRAVFLQDVSVINTFCLECAEEFEKLGIIIKK